MKIAFLSFYSGQIDRGVEVGNAELAKRLSKNHDITFFQAGQRKTSGISTIILNQSSDWPQDSSHSPWRKFYLDVYSRRILLFTVAFINFFLKNKYDLVIPTNGGWQVVIVRIITWIFGKKMLVQGNAGIGRDDLFQAYCFPDYFVAISPQGEGWIQQKMPKLKSSYIPYGVDIEKIHKTSSIDLHLAPPVVLCVSAFLSYKQIDLLIKAVEKTSMSLLLIGHGPEEKSLRELGERLLNGRFLIKTDVTHDQLINYYKSAHVFSLPSKSSEALGIVYLEALAAGLPIVAPDDKNRRLLIGEAGVYVDPMQTDKYAQALIAAYHGSYKESAQIKAQEYDWSVVIEKYNSIILKLYE